MDVKYKKNCGGITDIVLILLEVAQFQCGYRHPVAARKHHESAYRRSTALLGTRASAFVRDHSIRIVRENMSILPTCFAQLP